MSKSIIIDEAGLPKALTVDALRTSKQGGGTEDWLPTDETNLVELDIGGSGTYRASDYGAYGISVARVTPKCGGATSTAALQPVFANLHTPAIREGGNPKYMSARLLKTNLQSGGTCLWVPEDEVNLESKYVDHSGTYTARADGCYGFDQVTVSGVDVEITQDGDGDDVAEITDGGETREEKLPNSIVVEVPPTKTVYSEGQAIDYTGMVVKAYTRSGQLWTDASHPNGVIPISELTLPVTIAHAVPQEASSDLDTGAFTQPIPLSSVATFATTVKSSGVSWRWSVTTTPKNGGVMVIMKNMYDELITLFASAEPGEMGQNMTKSIYPNGEERISFYEHSSSRGYTVNDKTVYYVESIWGYIAGTDKLVNPFVSGYGDDSHVEQAAWTAVYGDKTGGCVIPVQWNRPYDAKLLETSFEIIVSQAGN